MYPELSKAFWNHSNKWRQGGLLLKYDIPSQTNTHYGFYYSTTTTTEYPRKLCINMEPSLKCDLSVFCFCCISAFVATEKYAHKPERS